MLLPPNTSPQHPRGQTEGCCFLGTHQPALACSPPWAAGEALLQLLEHLFPLLPLLLLCLLLLPVLILLPPQPAPPLAPPLPPPPAPPPDPPPAPPLLNWTLAGPFLTLLLPLSPLLDSSRCPLSSPPSGFMPQGAATSRAGLSFALWQCHRSQIRLLASALGQPCLLLRGHRQPPLTAPTPPTRL